MEKSQLRKLIAQRKKLYTTAQLTKWSSILLDKLEVNPIFRQAEVLMLYYSLPDEVQTHTFIERWSREKKIVLPVVRGSELDLYLYRGTDDLQKGSFGISEPTGQQWEELSAIGLALVPGVAFDTAGNRLGRGKGYYDRFLPRLQAHKIGICFGFQVMDEILVDAFDQPMDEVWTEEGRISKR